MWRRDNMPVMTPIDPTQAAALVTSPRWTTKTATADDGCVLWTGAKLRSGYGVININGQVLRTNRLALVAHLGRDLAPDAEAGDICHDIARANGECTPAACQHRACVNPHHLAEQTRTTNTRGGGSGCIHGHPLAADNLLNRSDGRRECKTCHRDRERARTRKAQ